MARMNLKNNSKKKRFKIIMFKYFIYLLLIYLSFSFSYYLNMKYSNIIGSKEVINMLLNDGNLNTLDRIEPTKIVSRTMNLLFSIDIAKPETILNDTIIKTAKVDKDGEDAVPKEDEEITIQEVEKASSYIEDPNPSSSEKPIVYLYNTHQLENYNSQYLEIYGIKPNVQMASYLLKEKLNLSGINTIVESEDITNTLKKRDWPYYRSYDVTRELIIKRMEDYPSLKYFIDIHRDSIDKEYTTININDKYYARVLFVLGLEYDSHDENLKMMEGINHLLEEKYPGLSRGILKKEGYNVNGIYNQDINSHVILIEIGSVNNTIEEVYNTVDAIAEVLNIYIGDDNN